MRNRERGAEKGGLMQVISKITEEYQLCIHIPRVRRNSIAQVDDVCEHTEQTGRLPSCYGPRPFSTSRVSGPVNPLVFLGER